MQWLSGKAALYLLLVLAILAGATVWPWLQREWFDPPGRLARAERLATVRAELAAEQDAAQNRLLEVALEARGKSVAALDAARLEAEAARAEAIAKRRTPVAKARSLAEGDKGALLADGRLELEIQYRDQEIDGLRAAIEAVRQSESLTRSAAWLRASLPDATRRCEAARALATSLEQRWEVRATFGLYDRGRRRAANDRRDRICARAGWLSNQLRAAEAGQRQIAAGRAAAGRANSQMVSVTADLEREIAKERAAAAGSWRAKATLWAERIHLRKVLGQAAVALALIIATPFLVRLICYFVLAPLAMRRPTIRLSEVDSAPIPPADRSSTSVSVRLQPGEELLVRQGYLQTTSVAGEKATQWLLDWRHPLTSCATGLTFLTRIQGQGEETTISAVRDPFAEVTILTLPEGASVVLHPRALAAVATPIARRLRISSHWRIGSLNAWLTLQLRYLVLRGPARLVLRGARGVRIEPAERGRVFSQKQLAGFSTDVGYSVTRTETFWPYFLGREPLLKDRVAAGTGLVIIEEAPAVSGGSKGVRKGFEGLVDAGLKVFGM